MDARLAKARDAYGHLSAVAWPDSKNKPKLAMAYGSLAVGSDIDLFMLFGNDQTVTSGRIGRLDIYSVTETEFCNLARLWDPLVTEPLLTGNILDGNNAETETSIVHHASRDEIPQHLRARANQYFEYAEQHSYTPEPTRTRGTLDNLSYAVSYMMFAQAYRDTSLAKPTTLTNLLEGNTELQQLIAARSAARNGNALDYDAIHKWLRAFHRLSSQFP